MLLNNDVVVTDGWLDQLIALASVRETTEVGRGDGRRGLEEQGISGEFAEGADRTTNPKLFTTEDTEGTEVEAGDGNGALEAGGSRRLASEQEFKTQNRRTNIGLVGPMSNYAAPPQLVADVPYRDLDEMKVFARAGARSTWARGSQCGSCRGFA